MAMKGSGQADARQSLPYFLERLLAEGRQLEEALVSAQEGIPGLAVDDWLFCSVPQCEVQVFQHVAEDLVIFANTRYVDISSQAA